MAKLTLTDIGTGHGSNTTLNANNTLIEDQVEQQLSRDGTSPNQMNTLLDMNSNKIINLPSATTSDQPATFGQLLAAGTLSLQGSLIERSTSGSGFTAGAGLVTLAAITYTPGLNNVQVFVNGVYQVPSEYTQNSTTPAEVAGLHRNAEGRVHRSIMPSVRRCSSARCSVCSGQRPLHVRP